MVPPPPARITKPLALIALLLGAAFMTPAVVVAFLAFVSWNAIAAGYALIWAALWFFGVPLVVLGAISLRRASRRLRRRQG